MNIDKIMNYLAQNFNGFENSFLRYTVCNVLEYANEHFSSLDEQLNFINLILPEVTIQELIEALSR